MVHFLKTLFYNLHTILLHQNFMIKVLKATDLIHRSIFILLEKKIEGRKKPSILFPSTYYTKMNNPQAYKCRNKI